MERIKKSLMYIYLPILAMPYIYIPLGSVNLRYDDLITIVLFILNIGSFVSLKKNVLVIRDKSWLLIFVYVFLSFLITNAVSGYDISSYAVVTYFGSIFTLITWSSILQDKKNLNFFFQGGIIAIVIFLIGVLKQYQSIQLAGEIEKSYQFKSAMGFDGLNPNSFGILSFIFACIGFLYSTSKIKKNKWLSSGVFILSICTMMIPYLVFARSASIGMTIAFTTLLILYVVRKRSLTSFFLVGVIILTITYLAIHILSEGNELVESATNIDINTGEGFSGRFEIWKAAINDVIPKSVLAGHGFTFCQQAIQKFSNAHGIAHNLILITIIELGLPVALVYFTRLINVLKRSFLKHKKDKGLYYAIQFSFFLGALVADMGGQNLYFTKYGFILIAICSTIQPIEDKL